MNKNKLKLLWFGLVPLGWFLALKMNIWIANYPGVWEETSASGLKLFFAMTGVFGSVALIIGAFALAVHLQD